MLVSRLVRQQQQQIDFVHLTGNDFVFVVVNNNKLANKNSLVGTTELIRLAAAAAAAAVVWFDFALSFRCCSIRLCRGQPVELLFA